jgi:hypothetical protein
MQCSGPVFYCFTCAAPLSSSVIRNDDLKEYQSEASLTGCIVSPDIEAINYGLQVTACSGIIPFEKPIFLNPFRVCQLNKLNILAATATSRIHRVAGPNKPSAIRRLHVRIPKTSSQG